MIYWIKIYWKKKKKKIFDVFRTQPFGKKFSIDMKEKRKKVVLFFIFSNYSPQKKTKEK